MRIPESEFLRYPRDAVREAITNALPRLSELRRNLFRAREELLLATGNAPLRGNFTALHGADLVLLQAGRQFCPRTPSSLRACDIGAI